MKSLHYFIAILSALVIVSSGLVSIPTVFAGRVLPGVVVGSQSLGGVHETDLPGVLQVYEDRLLDHEITIRLDEKEVTVSLRDLGVSLDIPATKQAIIEKKWLGDSMIQQTTSPVLVVDEQQVRQIAEREFTDNITLPRDATLEIVASGALVDVPSQAGEGIDTVTLTQDIRWRAVHGIWNQPVDLRVISAAPSVHDGELEYARQYAQKLLREGLILSYEDRDWDLRPFTLRRLIQFIPQTDPNDPNNEILGITLDYEGVVEYLQNTLVPHIDQVAVNARFAREGDRVTQFAKPQEGRQLNLEESAKALINTVQQQDDQATLAVDVTEPQVRDVSDMERLGITELIATGTSNFAGSPANRVHNIRVGTDRYHGLLISPGQDFSFNEFLGPVTAAAGYKPELVIKQNVTIPEYGGGLCQVSTTIFRAAIYSGLEITQRRNHAYAVSYYGTPGFDATIYPPYTDLRFTNNTPGYILIQARIEGSQLTFEFWGTDDGRMVEVNGPSPYDRQPDGAVKATLKQKVIKNGEVVIDDTFYSRYRSPDLFPRVLAANDPQNANNQPDNSDDNQTNPEQTPTPADQTPSAPEEDSQAAG